MDFKQRELEHKRVVDKTRFTVLRVDGKNFSSLTRNLQKPFDRSFVARMDNVAQALAENVDGVEIVFVQSDEVSVVIGPAEKETSELWVGGVEAKLISLTASIATAAFGMGVNAIFDSRVFSLDSRGEVQEYLRWRQADGNRNAISMIADVFLGKKVTVGVSTRDRVKMLTDAGVNFEAFPVSTFAGRAVTARRVVEDVEFTRRDGTVGLALGVTRTRWDLGCAPDFNTVMLLKRDLA